MILKKTIQNEKTVYAPITFEEAIKDRDEKDDLIFTDDDEKKNFDDILAQIEKAETRARKTINPQASMATMRMTTTRFCRGTPSRARSNKRDNLQRKAYTSWTRHLAISFRDSAEKRAKKQTNLCRFSPSSTTKTYTKSWRIF